jgi:hypothetical protein
MYLATDFWTSSKITKRFCFLIVLLQNYFLSAMFRKKSLNGWEKLIKLSMDKRQGKNHKSLLSQTYLLRFQLLQLQIKAHWNKVQLQVRSQSNLWEWMHVIQ